MTTDDFKEALSQLSLCHRCGQPAALDSTKGHPYCSNSNCVLFKYKMPQSTWNKMAECSNVVQLPQYHNVALQKIVDSMLYMGTPKRCWRPLPSRRRGFAKRTTS
jgi:hypothetical protein